MVNYNPETVSTDYDECDRLYFDEISYEVSKQQQQQQQQQQGNREIIYGHFVQNMHMYSWM